MNMISNGKSYTILEKHSSDKLKRPNEKFPSLEKFNWLIHLQHVRGEIEGCKTLIKKELERSNGRNEFALHKQGRIFREEGKLQEALNSFQACLRLNPENIENLKEAGKCLYEMHRLKLAKDAFLGAEAKSKNPDWEIYYYIGQCLMKLGDVSGAREYAHKAVQLGKHEFCYDLLIKILILQEDLKSAVAVSNAAVESCPDSVHMLTESGLLYMKVGQSQHAFERLSSALALEPTHPKALLGIGCITQRHDDYDVALTKYKMAIHYQPDSVALWNNIGMCFYSKQKYVAAISCLKRALWVQPLNWKILFNLGLAHLSTLQPASAFNFACAAVNLRPDVPDCFAVLGASLIELKDPENATRAFHQALLLSPEDPYVVVNTVLCCLLIGSEEEAYDLMSQFKILAEGEAPCSEELMDFAEKLTIELQKRKQTIDEPTENPKSNVSENTAGNYDPLKETDGETNGLQSQFGSAEVAASLLDPDEV